MSGTSFTVSSGSGEQVIVIPNEGGRLGRRSPGSSASIESHSGQSSAGSSWIQVHTDRSDYNDIEPSESASHSRHRSTSRRHHVAEAPEVPSRRHSVARDTEYNIRPTAHRSRSSRQHTRGESRRVPSDESTSTLASGDDYPYAHGHAQQQRNHFRYTHAPSGHGAYPPSQVGGYPDPFSAQDLVHMPRDNFGYPMGGGFSSGQGNPFAPMPPPSAPGYHPQEAFAPPQARPMPQSRVSMYAAPPYGGDMYHMPQMMHPGYGMYPGMPYSAHPPSQPSSPPPADAQNDKQFKDLKEMIKKHEEERLAWEKALVAKAEAEAAAKAAEAARAEEEKKKKAEIAAASSQAKEAAEKKAADDAKKAAEEAEKKLAEAKKAREEAEKKTKELEEEKKKNAPSPDSAKDPIKFKDAANRKFSFPWGVCKTWKGMEGLVRQAFAHIDVLGDHVLQGHYDLMGPDGEIILPQVWETTVQPGWEIEMVMWPITELAPPMAQPAHGHDLLGGMSLEELLGPAAGPAKPKKGAKVKVKDKGKKPAVVNIPIPPPLGGARDPLAEMVDLFPQVMVVNDKGKAKSSSSSRSGSKSSKDIPPFMRWMYGGPPPKKRG